MRCRADGDCVRRRLTLTFGGHSFVCEVIETDVVGRCIAPHGIRKITRRIFGVRLIVARTKVSDCFRGDLPCSSMNSRSFSRRLMN